MRNDFSTFDIGKAFTNIPLEKLRNWMKQGFIFPTYPAEGKGKRAVFTREDVYAISLIDQLMANGVAGHIAGAFAIEAFKTPRNSRAHYILFSHEQDGGRQIIRNTTFHNSNYFTLSDFTEDWRHVQIINLDKIRKEVNRALEILEP